MLDCMTIEDSYMLISLRPSILWGQMSIWGHLGSQGWLSRSVYRFSSSSSSVNISLTYTSDMTWPILTRLGHKYRLTIPFMSYDQIGVKGHIGVTGVKNSKTLLLLQTTGYGHMTHVYTYAWPPLQKLLL